MNIVLLAPHHNRNAFDCGKEELNHFIRSYAGQYSKKDMGRTYVAVATNEDSHILGYYTISVSSVPMGTIPGKLPKHDIPVVHLGRLARDKSVRGLGIGKILLFHALRLSMRIANEAGAHAVEVVALDDEAQRFYEEYDFVAFPTPPAPGERVHLYLPISKIRPLFPEEQS